MEEYERACCIQGYHEYKVLTALLVKAFVHDSHLHHLVAGGSLTLANILNTIIRSPEDHPLA